MTENDLRYLKKIARDQLTVLCMLTDQISSVQGKLNSPQESAVYQIESEQYEAAFDLINNRIK